MLGAGLGARLGRTSDLGVQDTNDDAQISKLSCVRHGYFQDAFIHHFVRRPARRSPLINRGYYSRYAALRGLLLQFLALGLERASSGGSGSAANGASAPAPAVQQQQQPAQGQPDQPAAGAAAASGTGGAGTGTGGDAAAAEPEAGAAAQPPGSADGGAPAAPPNGQAPLRRQVLVLGAGFDTTFFQLAAEGIRADKYIELDFLQVCQKKALAIQQLPELLACLGGAQAAAGISPEEGRVLTERYCLLPADLRDLAQLEAALAAAGLDPAAPTYVVSECVLVYLKPQHSRDLVRWLAGRLRHAAMAVYEQINPHDAFGQQMLLNLESRGCALLGIEATPDLEAQRRRFTECGWHRAEAHSMDHVYSRCIDPADRQRVERLEIFDEFEEWHLIQQHYCIAVATKDDGSGLLRRFGLPQFAAPPPGLPQSAGLGGGRPPVPRFAG